MSTRHGPPKHQNKLAWIPNAGHKKNEKELGGKFRPYSEITGVCPRCKEQIEWKRRYGKYKPLLEPAKCQKCTKRSVRQAYHSICSGCAKDFNVCAKCCCSRDQIVGREPLEVEAEQNALKEAIKNARERDRRTLLRALWPSSSNGESSSGIDQDLREYVEVGTGAKVSVSVSEIRIGIIDDCGDELLVVIENIELVDAVVYATFKCVGLVKEWIEVGVGGLVIPFTHIIF